MQRDITTNAIDPADRFLKVLYESKCIAHTYGKEKAKRQSEKEVALQQKLVAAQSALESNP